MKRHPALEPFSRDHNVALVLARELIRSSEQTFAEQSAAAATLVRFWSDEMRDHFAQEEELLLPLTVDPSLQDRLVGEHQQLKTYVDDFASGKCDAGRLASAGALLNDHVRWEERTLFPAIEQAATPEQLKCLAEQTSKLELSREGSNWAPRRGKLAKSRKSSTDKRS